MSQESLTEALSSVDVHVPEIEISDVEPVLEDEIASPSSPSQAGIHAPTNIPLSQTPQTEVQLTVQVEAREEEPQVGQLLCDFEASDTAQNIAISILSDSIPNRSVALRDLVWRLIYEDKLALAFHIVKCIESSYPNLQLLLPSWLIHALTISRQVCKATGALAHLLKSDFTQFDEATFVPSNHEWNHAIRFLLAAAALRPALLTSDTDASRLLHSLRMKEGLNELWGYCEDIANYGEQQLPLDPNALKRAKDQAAWQTEMESLCQQVHTWCAQAPNMTMAYAPATNVWRHWQETGGLIHSFLMLVRQNDPRRIEEVKEQIKKLSDDSEIKRQIIYTDRKILQRRLGNDITARALGQLLAHVREAVEFARRWISLYEASVTQNQRKTYVQQQAEQIRQKVWSRQDVVLEELADFAQSYSSLCIMSSIAACRRAVEDIRRLFDPDATFLDEESLVPHLLQVDFLRIPGLMLNDEWEPVSCEPASVLDALLQLLAEDRFSWPQALEAQCKVRNHEATARIIEYLEAHPADGISVDTLRTARERHLHECQAALRRDIESTEQEVNVALTFGWLRDSEFRDYDSTLESMLFNTADSFS